MDRFETFTGSILELNRSLQKLKEIEMKPFGLRANHVMCLYHLGKYPQGLTVTEMAEVCKEDKAAVSRCLAQLTQRELVQGAFPDHKRSYRTKLTLTPSGRELAEKINQRVEAALIGGSTGLTEEQRDTFYTAMKIIIKNLSRYIAQRDE